MREPGEASASPVKPETTNMYSVMLKTDFKSLDYNSTLNSLESLWSYVRCSEMK